MAVDQAVVAKADLSQLYKKLSRLRAATPSATGEALKVIMTNVMKAVIDATGNDTNRMDRGFALAANAAGLGPFHVPQIQPSKYFDQNRSTLIKQIKKWTKFEEFYLSQGKELLKGRPPDRVNAGKVSPFFRLIQRRRKAAEEQLAKFTNNSVFVIDNRKNRLRFTVRTPIHGGDGSFRIIGDTAVVEMHNREPHAIILERANRTVATTLKGAARKAGVKAGTRRMAQHLKKVAATGSVAY